MNELNTTESKNFFIVAIGASAGGLQPLESFFGNLPDKPNAAFVVVQHLSPDFKSIMSKILQRHTSMPVSQIEDGMNIEPSQVYVLPPKKHLITKAGKLCLVESPESFDYPIDKFFRSLIEEWGEKTIAILLSGTGSDGTKGIQAISQAGGIGLVQSPKTAQFNSMPSNAIPSGSVDEILSPQELAQTVFELIRYSDNFPNSSPEEAATIDTEQLQTVLDILAQRENIDFSYYKVSTLSRRIHHRCALNHSDDLQKYIELLKNSEEEQKLLRRDLLIGVTQFFRDSNVWEYLATEILPKLIRQLKTNEQLRIWVSACATGEEAYSMAILVHEALAKANKSIQVKIFATDIDTEALKTTAQGIYPQDISNNITSERLETYFTFTGEHYRVKRFLREMLIVAPHDLTKNAGFSKMNLVSCRNVLIYMQPQLQQHVLKLLHFALASGGILLLGSSETLGSLGEEFTTIESKWKLFRKRRDITLSAGQITRQPLPTQLQVSRNKIEKDRQIDRLLSEVFKFCLNDRKITCLLVNQNNQLLRIFYNEARLLEFPVGEAILDITEIVNPKLKLPLSTALHRAKRDEKPVLYTGIRIERGGEEVNVSLRVDSPAENLVLEAYLIVVLEIETPAAAATTITGLDLGEEAAHQITELEYELQQTKENLQVTIEELETTNEEQQATNEELLASNEELQSINEEMQSVNEELYTVNSEHQLKIQELTQLNNDIDNLLRSTDIGVIFLDRQLNIRKFTPAATKAINIKPNDVGRPLRDITNNLEAKNLNAIFQQAVETQEPIEREVTIAGTKEQLLMRVNLYLRENGDSDGVVVTFIRIDELKKVQQELHRTNSLLENLYTTSPAGLSLHDSNFRYLRVNQALADINGVSVEEHLGKTVREIIPDLADNIELILRQVLETNQPVCNVQISGNTHADFDSERHWSASYYPVDLLDGKQGVGSVIVDISDRIYAEESLRKSETNLLEAQKLANLGNWELEISDDYDLDNVRGTWSAEMFRIYGLDPRQQVPTFGELIQLHPPKDRRKIRSAWKKLLTNCTAYNIDVLLNRPDGETRYLNSRGRASCNQAGKKTKVYGAVIDITERKQIEAELMRQNRALEEASAVAQAADSANQAKSDFLANMSHEIRTPMNAILSVGQLLNSTELNSDQRKLLDTLKINGDRLLNIINDILDLSKIEAKELKLDNQEFSIASLADSIFNSFIPQAQAKNLELTTDLDPNLAQLYVGDDFRLQQVIGNLVSNALKFTEQGQIKIAIAPEHNSKPESDSTAIIRFSVEDTGIGIPKSQQEKLFQPFTQADSSTTRQYGGTGLGLTICRRIVELMGGEINVESTVGAGSTFWFTVPLEIVKHEEKTAVIEASNPTAENATPKSPKNTKILVVEDYPDNRDLLVFVLNNIGYKTDSVCNGQEALDRLAEEDYDLILMDCQMPKIDGYQAAQRIRQGENQRHTIIIGLTAHAMSSDRQKCLDAGMDDYLSKPIDFDKLDETIQKWS